MLSRKYLFQALLLLLSMPARAQTLTLVFKPSWGRARFPDYVCHNRFSTLFRCFIVSPRCQLMSSSLNSFPVFQNIFQLFIYFFCSLLETSLHVRQEWIHQDSLDIGSAAFTLAVVCSLCNYQRLIVHCAIIKSSFKQVISTWRRSFMASSKGININYIKHGNTTQY